MRIVINNHNNDYLETISFKDLDDIQDDTLNKF